MDPQGIWRTYKDKPASLQGWGHQGCCHISKLALGLNSVLLCWVLGLHPSPQYHTFLTRLSGGVGEACRHRHHLGWCPHHTGWTLQWHQGLGCLEPGSLSAMNGQKRDSVRLGSVPVETPSDSSSIIPGMFPSRPHSQAEAWLFTVDTLNSLKQWWPTWNQHK